MTNGDHSEAQGAAARTGAPSTLRLAISRSDATITDCDESSAAVLGSPREALIGQPWQEVLGSTSLLEMLLHAALRYGWPIELPPLLVALADGREQLARGNIVSSAGQCDLTLLLLPQAFSFSGTPAAQSGDCLLAIGVDRVGYQQLADIDERSRIMMDIRAGLSDIVRAEDSVSLPLGNQLLVSLHDTAVEQALDIARALLSHIHNLPQSRSEGAAARTCAGLCQVTAGRGPARSTLAALHALLHEQHFTSRERMRVANDRDAGIVAGITLDRFGIVAETELDPRQQAYLNGLEDIAQGSTSDTALLNELLQLTLKHLAVSTCGIYRRHFDGRCSLVAAGNAEQSGVNRDERKLGMGVRRAIKQLDKATDAYFREPQHFGDGVLALPLISGRHESGFLVLQCTQAVPDFVPDSRCSYMLARLLQRCSAWKLAAGQLAQDPSTPSVNPMETGIEGYVGDNMEGAVDQAVFLAGLDVPIAIIGARGTGKMYVAKTIHAQTGADALEVLDCRQFRNRREAIQGIQSALVASANQTLVFKSPQSMHPEAQNRLAKQLSSRRLADASPPRYLPPAKYLALFPASLEELLAQKSLTAALASVFGAYPIVVPPIKDRRQAVLRWAHKILGQECAQRDRIIKGFTPDAEAALLQHDWPGNISEMRQCLVSAIERSRKEWITPVDLGMYGGVSADTDTSGSTVPSFLESLHEPPEDNSDSYQTSPLEAMDLALGKAVSALRQQDAGKALGTWLEDEIITGSMLRFGGDQRRAAAFLHTRSRNLGRWLPRVESREAERRDSSLWQDCQQTISTWISSSGELDQSPLAVAEQLLLAHIEAQCESSTLVQRAAILGVSPPTYQKRLQQQASVSAPAASSSRTAS